MAQWVKKLTTEVRVQSPAWHSGLKDLALLQLCCSLQLWLRISPWLGNSHMLWVQPIKTPTKTNKQRKKKKNCSASKVNPKPFPAQLTGLHSDEKIHVCCVPCERDRDEIPERPQIHTKNILLTIFITDGHKSLEKLAFCSMATFKEDG